MHRLIAAAQRQGRGLEEHEAMELFGAYGIPVPGHALARDVDEAANLAAGLGYPVVLKIVSKDILHKSDVGGVKVGLNTEDALRDAYRELRERVARHAPKAEIEGVLVAQCLPPGLECIVGMTRDSQFGTALLFGLGGVFVEVLEDVAFQLMPLTREEALAMIRSIKGARLLSGYRGSAPCDVDALADLILRVGALAADHPEIQEIDINPVFAYEKGIMAVDARILLS